MRSALGIDLMAVLASLLAIACIFSDPQGLWSRPDWLGYFVRVSLVQVAIVTYIGEYDHDFDENEFQLQITKAMHGPHGT